MKTKLTSSILTRSLFARALPLLFAVAFFQAAGSLQAQCASFSTVYVDDNWVGTPIGTDPDGPGPATNFGCDSFATIQGGIDGVTAPGTVVVAAGTYDEDVVINKADVSVLGAGAGSTNVRGPIGGPGTTMQVAASNVTIAGFTITRLGNNTTDWNNAGLNSIGIAVQGQAVTGMLVRDNILTGNRTGVDVNNSNGHTIRNNVIDFNRTGLIFRNQTDNTEVVENFITNNWTVGVLFLDASGGSNVPLQQALNSHFYNNNLSANWYGQVVDRQSGGSLPAPGANVKYFTGNWWGTTMPVVTTANSAEPGYAAQIPVAYGGSAVPPGGQPDIAGPASANIAYLPLLCSGTDTNVETTPGRGVFGFQGGPPCPLVPATAPTTTDNDYTRINNAVQAASNGQTIKLLGTFNWTEPNAAASWAQGSNGIAGDGDDYSILVPANLHSVIFTADNLGDATIQGPGDRATVNLEGVLFFDSIGGSTNQNWTISKIRFVDFDLAIGMFAGAADAYHNTSITSNYIKIAQDLNATVAPTDVNQNIGIHYSFGKNQTISGNTIDFNGDGVSAGSNFSTQVGMQSNTSGGDVYDGLQITNNILRVLSAESASPQNLLGIWENGHAHSSDITVNGNSFTNFAAENNPGANLQRGFRVTSHSSATTAVNYLNNTVSGANIGFQWLAGTNFAGNQPVNLTSNTILGNGTGVLVQSQGVANLQVNRIVGNSAAGLNNVDGTVNAENNWWGCNAGPGAAGCDAVTGIADSNPWLVLNVNASPNPIPAFGMSNVTADMTDNSGAMDTTGFGTVPQTPVAFSATEGTMAPPSGTITAGMANSTFTSTSDMSGTACATVDNQLTCTNITVIAPTPTPTPTPMPTTTPTPTPPASPTPSPSPIASATPTPSPTATPTATPAQTLNISTRVRVETADRVAIGGFIVQGSASKPVLIRGLGPSLTAFGVVNALLDPFLELRGPGGLIMSNDNWMENPQRAQFEGTVFQPTDVREAVVVASVPPENYTVILSGVSGTTGVGLIEIYDRDQAVDAVLANISTRGFVQTGENVMIGGFILGNATANTGVVVRGLGPSLVNFGVTDFLADPTLELRSQNGTLLVANDDWTDDAASAAQLTLVGLDPEHPDEAAIFTSLPPGQFTAILAGKNGGIGIGLVEIYNLR